MFENIYGHLRVKEVLKKYIVSGEFPHALLFTGIYGIGKFTLAKEFTKSVNCTERDPNRRPCNVCKNCTSFSRSIFPDYIELFADREPDSVRRFNKLLPSEAETKKKKEDKEKQKAISIKISQIREIIGQVSIGKFYGKYKTVIIKDAKFLTEEAANTLLKTLEEPPENVIFILITENINSILPTIVSRCQVIRFFPLDNAVIIEFIREHSELKEFQEASLIKLAKGSIGRILNLDEKSFYKNYKLISRLLTELELVLGNQQDILDITDIIVKTNRTKPDKINFISILQNAIKDIFLSDNKIPEEYITFTDLKPLKEKLDVNLESLSDFLEYLELEKGNLYSNVNPYFVFFNIFTTLKSKFLTTNRR